MPRKEETTKKQDNLKKELTKYLNKQIDKKINEKVKIEKQDYDQYIQKKIDEKINITFRKNEKKLLRRKNYIIIRKNIIILLLITLYAFTLYYLYQNSYLDDIINHKHKQVITKQTQNKNDLKEKYSYLLDNIFINEKSEYIKDYYSGNLTPELKLYLAFNNIDKEMIEEDNFTYINKEDLKKEYKKIFNDTISYRTFNYNGIELNYLKQKQIFIIDGDLKNNKTKIEREIEKITKNNNKIEITTVEGIIDDNQLYDVYGNKISNYKSEKKLSDYKLNKTIYTFEKDNNHKLINIRKKVI